MSFANSSNGHGECYLELFECILSILLISLVYFEHIVHLLKSLYVGNSAVFSAPVIDALQKQVFSLICLTVISLSLSLSSDPSARAA